MGFLKFFKTFLRFTLSATLLKIFFRSFYAYTNIMLFNTYALLLSSVLAATLVSGAQRPGLTRIIDGYWVCSNVVRDAANINSPNFRTGHAAQALNKYSWNTCHKCLEKNVRNPTRRPVSCPVDSASSS